MNITSFQRFKVFFFPGFLGHLGASPRMQAHRECAKDSPRFLAHSEGRRDLVLLGSQNSWTSKFNPLQLSLLRLASVGHLCLAGYNEYISIEI